MVVQPSWQIHSTYLVKHRSVEICDDLTRGNAWFFNIGQCFFGSTTRKGLPSHRDVQESQKAARKLVGCKNAENVWAHRNCGAKMTLVSRCSSVLGKLPRRGRSSPLQHCPSASNVVSVIIGCASRPFHIAFSGTTPKLRLTTNFTLATSKCNFLADFGAHA